MSASINTVTLSGTINQECREKDIGDGHVVETELAFTVPSKDGPKEQWIEIAGWGNVGDALARIPEGHEVIVSGSLQRRAWKDKEENWQSRYSIRLLQIQELGSLAGEDVAFSDVPVDNTEPQEQAETGDLPF